MAGLGRFDAFSTRWAMSTPRTTRLGVRVRVGSQARAAGVECITRTSGRCRTVCAIVKNNLR